MKTTEINNQSTETPSSISQMWGLKEPIETQSTQNMLKNRMTNKVQWNESRMMHHHCNWKSVRWTNLASRGFKLFDPKPNLRPELRNTRNPHKPSHVSAKDNIHRHFESKCRFKGQAHGIQTIWATNRMAPNCAYDPAACYYTLFRSIHLRNKRGCLAAQYHFLGVA